MPAYDPMYAETKFNPYPDTDPGADAPEPAYDVEPGAVAQRIERLSVVDMKIVESKHMLEKLHAERSEIAMQLRRDLKELSRRVETIS